MTLSPASLQTVQGAEIDFKISNGSWGWSSEVFDILGISESLRPSTDLVVACKHPDDRPTTKRLLTDALTYRGPFCFQNRNVRSDGHLRTVETTGTIAAAPNGSPRALVEKVVVVSDWTPPIFDEAVTGESSEGNLAVALLARIEDAHAYVFKCYASIVAQTSRRVLHDRAQVDDVVQSVFEQLWLNPSRFDPTRGSLANYLKLSTRCRSIDIARSESARSKRAVRLAHEASDMNSAENDVIASISGRDLRRALDCLPDTERTAIELAYFGDMSYRMAAQHLGLPEGTVKSQIRSGLSRLRNLHALPSG
jgi:RNA polymerase sigma-70 factor, ECF subfamily